MGKEAAFHSRRWRAGWLSVLGSMLILAGSVQADSGPREVRLGGGGAEGFSWTVALRRGDSGQAASRPCLDVFVSIRRQPGDWSASRLAVCGSVMEAPLIVANSEGEGGRQRTAIGMAFPSRVRSVRLFLQGRRSRMIRLSKLDSARRHRAGVMPLNYATAGFAGLFCLVRVVSYAANGTVLDGGHGHECQAGGGEALLSPLRGGDAHHNVATP